MLKGKVNRLGGMNAFEHTLSTDTTKQNDWRGSLSTTPPSVAWDTRPAFFAEHDGSLLA